MKWTKFPEVRKSPEDWHLHFSFSKHCLKMSKQTLYMMIMNNYYIKPLPSETFSIHRVFHFVAHTGPWLTADAIFCCWSDFNEFAPYGLLGAIHLLNNFMRQTAIDFSFVQFHFEQFQTSYDICFFHICLHLLSHELLLLTLKASTGVGWPCPPEIYAVLTTCPLVGIVVIAPPGVVTMTCCTVAPGGNCCTTCCTICWCT